MVVGDQNAKLFEPTGGRHSRHTATLPALTVA
jgi:hypothetical protein